MTGAFQHKSDRLTWAATRWHLGRSTRLLTPPEQRLRGTVGCIPMVNLRSGPSSQSQTGRNDLPRATPRREPGRREILRPAATKPPRVEAAFRGRRNHGRHGVALAIRQGSQSCTSVGVERLGRGERVHRGVKPATRQYPSLAAGFRRRALFFEPPPGANQSTSE